MMKRAIVLLGPLVLGLPLPAAAQQGQYVAREGPGWLGVGYESRWIQRDGQCEPQVLVEQVLHGSPAERAGLRPGDALVALNGRPIPAATLEDVASRLAPGDSVRLQVVRNGRTREVTAVADRRPLRPPVVLLPSGPAGRGSLRAAAAPIVHMEGPTLVARNVDDARGARGYWFATDDGRTVYRALGSWSDDGMDERVVRLLQCAERVEWRPAAATRVDVRRIQERADSLRVVIAQRMLERGAVPAAPSRTAVARAPRGVAPAQPPGDSYVLRLEDHLAAGLRGVAGAEMTALEPELAAYFDNVRDGLLVLRISTGTPAHRAGLAPGDVITQGNGRTLESVNELRALLAAEGQPVELHVVRKGRARTLTFPRP